MNKWFLVLLLPLMLMAVSAQSSSSSQVSKYGYQYICLPGCVELADGCLCPKILIPVANVCPITIGENDKEIKEVTTKPTVNTVLPDYTFLLRIFSDINNPSFRGEGFFINISGEELFIYSNFSDSPHDITNTGRSLTAVLKGIGSVTYKNYKEADIYHETKFELNAENAVLSVAQYESLVPRVIENGVHKKAKMVNYKDIVFAKSQVTFNTKDIVSIDELSMTTGGSVYIFTVNFKDGQFLNIIEATARDDAKTLLNNMSERLSSLMKSDKLIVANDPQYNDVIYTMNGVRKGWTAWVLNTEIV